MRKLISGFLVVAFLFNIGGYYLWFSTLKYSLEKEMEKEIGESLSEKDLSIIIIPLKGKPGIVWIRPDKEFSYKGEMYDVVKIHYKNQQKYLYCKNDTREKELITNFNITRSSKKETEKKLKRNFNFSFYIQPNTISKNLYPIDLKFITTNILYKSTIVDIHSPPPKSA